VGRRALERGAGEAGELRHVLDARRYSLFGSALTEQHLHARWRRIRIRIEEHPLRNLVPGLLRHAAAGLQPAVPDDWRRTGGRDRRH